MSDLLPSLWNLRAAPLQGRLPCRCRSLPLPRLPSRWLRKPRVPLALLSPAPGFPLCRVLTTAPGSSVNPGQHKYFLDISCFTFSLHAPHCPAPQSCLHHPGGKPPSSHHSGGPSLGPTHMPPSPTREGRCTPSSLGGPVDRIPSPLRPGAIFQRASGEGWGGSTCAPHPSLSKGQGQAEGTSPSCGPRSPACLRQNFAWHPAS